MGMRNTNRRVTGIELKPEQGQGMVQGLAPLPEIEGQGGGPENAASSAVEPEAMKPGSVIVPGRLENAFHSDCTDGVTLNLPVAEAAGGYSSRHVEVGRLTPRQTRALRMLREGLCEAGEKIAVGSGGEVRRVQSNADVVRWILESVGKTCGV